MAVVLAAFIINDSTPGSPVDRLITSQVREGDALMNDAINEKQKNIWREKLGLNLPVFYFSIYSAIEEHHVVYNDEHLESLYRFCVNQFGNSEASKNYINTLNSLYELLLKPDTAQQNSEVRFNAIALCKNIIHSTNVSVMDASYVALQSLLEKANASSLSVFLQSKNEFQKLKQQTSEWKAFLPVLTWNTDNRFHRWLTGDGYFSKGLLHGDLGTSYLTKEKVWKVISGKMLWTILLTFFSVLIAYVVSIPIGIRAAMNKNSRLKNVTGFLPFILFSIPVFCMGTILLMTFCNADFINIFPSSGIQPLGGFDAEVSWWQKIIHTIPYLILPVFCYTYSSVAFLTKTLSSSISEIEKENFILTARAKGLGEKEIYFKHAFRNALLPLITLFSEIFPHAIAGSVIIETIFSIPGMGTEIYNSIATQNYPVIIAVFLISSLLSMTGYLVSDILYAWADPRIKFSKQKV